MLYTELLKLWDESVQAVDARDWQAVLDKLGEITEPTSRTLFNAAAAYLSLGQPEEALRALDFALAKDERLAVGFFQRAAVMMQLNRLEEALSDCIWAQKHMRGNMVIDYKQLGLWFKLYSWQVLYNAAAVYCRMEQWEQASEVLLSASQEREAGGGGGRGGHLEAALESVARQQVLEPLMVPEGLVFRPRKQDVEQLQQRDFLGKAKVITSLIPNDDFAGFDPLRLQKPGYYEPKVDGSQETRYMRVRGPFMARGPGQLTVPGGATAFLFGEEDRDGMVSVICNGERGLVPVSLLEPVDAKTLRGKKDNRVPTGIPLPPENRPPSRPQAQHGPVAPPRAKRVSTSASASVSAPRTAGKVSDAPPPSYNVATHVPPPPAANPPKYTANPAGNQVDVSPGAMAAAAAAAAAAPPVTVKVHYTYTVALSVPLDTPYQQLKEEIAQKLDLPAHQLRLRYKQHGSRVLIPLGGDGDPGRSVQEVAEAGRATLWCQAEDLLKNRPILYQMVALYEYAAQSPEDLDFSEGQTIDVLNEVNEEWLEGHCAGHVGIFPRCFAYRESDDITQSEELSRGT